MQGTTTFSAFRANGRAIGPTKTAAVSAAVGVPARSTARPKPFIRGRGGSRYAHAQRPLMILIGNRAAGALNDGQVAVVVQPAERLHARVKAKRRVDLVQLVRRQPQSSPVPAVPIIRVGDDGIQAVIAAGELKDHEDRVTVIALLRRQRRADKEIRNGRAQGHQRRSPQGSPQKIASGRQHSVFSSVAWASRP
jgi:hypothetical protein